MKKIIISILALFLVGFSATARVPEGDLLEGVSPGPDGRIDVLTIFAHQDDESIHNGGTLLKLKKDPRVRLHVACLTLGDASEARFFLGIDSEHMARIRVEELETAAVVLGAEQVIQLGYHDHHLKSVDQETLVKEILEIIERTRAEVVITHDPAGITRNPDHIACSRAVSLAFPESGAKRLYYATLPLRLYIVPYVITQFVERAVPARPTLKVDISEERRLKRMALYAHASQNHFSFVGITMAQAALLNHEWFALAQSNE